VRGIAIVENYARMLSPAVCADKYLNIPIKAWTAWLDQFEVQFAFTVTAAHGWQRLYEVTHMRLLLFDMRRIKDAEHSKGFRQWKMIRYATL